MTRTDQIDIALAALIDLRKLHEKFLEFLGAHCEPPPRSGTVAVNDGEIQITCLGIALRCEVRPVTDSGEFAAYEYAFFADFRGTVV